MHATDYAAPRISPKIGATSAAGGRNAVDEALERRCIDICIVIRRDAVSMALK
jgi:hypothetical protein